jgi:uncharacterized protein (UPF0264 family)
MTGLLVSVRSAAEAATALAGGADIIDVKEPRRGALGPADPSVWREILSIVGRRAPVSAALGELHSDEILEYASNAAGFAYAKVGLSDWRRRSDSPSKWSQAKAALPANVAAVPVVYADLEATGWEAFSASAVAAITLAVAGRSPLLVIDTFQKDGRKLLDLVTLGELKEVDQFAFQSGIRLVLAGSLDEKAIEKLLPLEPAYIGVRGAACNAGRDGTIELARVKSLARLVHGARQKAAS